MCVKEKQKNELIFIKSITAKRKNKSAFLLLYFSISLNIVLKEKKTQMET